VNQCPVCGHRVVRTHQFCTACGSALTGPLDQTAEQPPADPYAEPPPQYRASPPSYYDRPASPSYYEPAPSPTNAGTRNGMASSTQPSAAQPDSYSWLQTYAPADPDADSRTAPREHPDQSFISAQFGQPSTPVYSGPTGGSAGGYDQPPRDRGPRRAPLAAIIVVALLVIGLAGFGIVKEVFSGSTADSGSNSPGTSAACGSGCPSAKSSGTSGTASSAAQTETRQMASVLRASARARTLVVTGVRKVQGCSDVSGGTAEIKQVVAAREGLTAQVQGLQVDALQDGAAAKTTLQQAMQYSLDADRAFLRWAQSAHCRHGHAVQGPSYKAAVAYSGRALGPKNTFNEQWAAIVDRADLSHLRGLGNFL
jgi:hypothetical protein